jgi:hypothetical protein
MIDRGYYYEITEWLINYNFTSEEELRSFSRDSEKSNFIYRKLKELEQRGDLLLLDFEWQFLPIEIIKITCTTKEEQRLFTYGL